MLNTAPPNNVRRSGSGSIQLRTRPPFHPAPLGDVHAMWLLESEHRALVLVPSGHADLAWHAIEQGGRRQHICCVGHDAVARYALLERRTGQPIPG